MPKQNQNFKEATYKFEMQKVESPEKQGEENCYGSSIIGEGLIQANDLQESTIKDKTKRNYEAHV